MTGVSGGSRIRINLEKDPWDRDTSSDSLDFYFGSGDSGQVIATDQEGNTPLRLAIDTSWSPSLEIITLLVEAGADAAAGDKEGTTVLRHAADQTAPEVIRLLLKQGAYLKSRDGRMNTPLHSAVIDDPRSREKPTLRPSCFCWKPAPTSTPNYPENTPVHYAVEHQRPDAVCLLLNHGADATSRNDFARTPLHSAMDDGSSITNGRSCFSVLDMLLEYCANPNAADLNLITPLQLAADWHYRPTEPETVALLLENGADPNATDDNMLTPLHVAASSNSKAPPSPFMLLA